jgi:hypothetical protein
MEIAAPTLGSGACASPMPTRSPRLIQVSGFRKTYRSTAAVDDVWFEVYDAAGVLPSGGESLGGRTYSLWTKPLGYDFVATCSSRMSLGRGPNNGMGCRPS